MSDRPIFTRLLPEDRDRWVPVIERVFGGVDELMAGDAQDLLSDQLLNYSEENRKLIAQLPTLIVDDERQDG